MTLDVFVTFDALMQAGTETAGGQHSEEKRDLEAGNCLEVSFST